MTCGGGPRPGGRWLAPWGTGTVEPGSRRTQEATGLAGKAHGAHATEHKLRCWPGSSSSCPLAARTALCHLHPPEHQAQRPRGHGATAAQSRASPQPQGAHSAHSLTFLLSSACQWQGRPDWQTTQMTSGSGGRGPEQGEDPRAPCLPAGPGSMDSRRSQSQPAWGRKDFRTRRGLGHGRGRDAPRGALHRLRAPAGRETGADRGLGLAEERP